jgi:hypothetical protein
MSGIDDIFKDDESSYGQDLVGWVMGKCNDWRDHYEANYAEKHEEYMRLYRNQWSAEDMERKSERSKLIAPALAQAVESNVAEIEESTFGRGKIFDLKDDVNDEETTDMVYLRKKLHEDLKLARVRTSVAEVLISAAVYGTGVAEIVLDEIKTYKPATQPMGDLGMAETGVMEAYRPIVRMNPVQPKNFLIDPAAPSVDEALGCAVDEYVSRHIVEELQESGVYRDEFVGDAAADTDIEPDPGVTSLAEERIRLTKYYGKVPRALLLDADVDEEDIAEDGHYVEAVVVIGNEGTLLKAIANPYMCQDRPVVAFQWDIIPGIFWGRGVCEKGYMSQKALDTELRARVDALALTTHPMLAVDATRIPRGHKLEVRPGRMIMTNGNPGESLMPFNFGQLNGVTFQQGAQLQQMVSQATGAAEANAGMVQNDVTAAGQSMSQGAIMKRQKRTLVNFQENFLIPFIKKTATRYMQFDPENYPVQDYTFTPFSSLGAMAREYEVSQLSQILQMVGPESPAHGPILAAIIDHMNVANREEVIAAIQQGSQPDPAAAEAAQKQQQMQEAITQGQIQLLQAQAAESQSRAQKYGVEAQLYPQELTLKYSDQDNDGQVDAGFEQKLKIADLLLREKQIDQQAAAQQSKDLQSKQQAEAELIKQLTSMGGQGGQPNDSGSTPPTTGAGF